MRIHLRKGEIYANESLPIFPSARLLSPLSCPHPHTPPPPPPPRLLLLFLIVVSSSLSALSPRPLRLLWEQEPLYVLITHAKVPLHHIRILLAKSISKISFPFLKRFPSSSSMQSTITSRMAGRQTDRRPEWRLDAMTPPLASGRARQFVHASSFMCQSLSRLRVHKELLCISLEWCGGSWEGVLNMTYTRYWFVSLSLSFTLSANLLLLVM